MSSQSVNSIRMVGGHPALDLLNTVDPGASGIGGDVLRAFRDAVSWATRAGILSPGDEPGLLDQGARSPALALKAHLRLVDAREALRPLVRAEAEGSPLASVALAAFARLVDESASFRCFGVHEGRLGWKCSDGDLDAVLHRAVFMAAELLADPGRRAIKVCAGANCGWFFLDRSKSHGRRWCSDASCGSNARVRRFRARG